MICISSSQRSLNLFSIILVSDIIKLLTKNWLLNFNAKTIVIMNMTWQELKISLITCKNQSTSLTWTKLKQKVNTPPKCNFLMTLIDKEWTQRSKMMHNMLKKKNKNPKKNLATEIFVLWSSKWQKVSLLNLIN